MSPTDDLIPLLKRLRVALGHHRRRVPEQSLHVHVTVSQLSFPVRGIRRPIFVPIVRQIGIKLGRERWLSKRCAAKPCPNFVPSRSTFGLNTLEPAFPRSYNFSKNWELMPMKIPQPPPSMVSLLKKYSTKEGAALMRTVITGGFDPAPGGKYRHWDTLRRLTPPDGLTVEDWWFAVKLARTPILRPLALVGVDGNPFKFAMPDAALERAHHIDCNASGRIATAEEVTNPATRDQYLVNSLMEEAITSSQLEGASTTRRIAKEMIRNGRPPSNTDEQMIYNNYIAMKHIREIIGTPLTVERVFELHKMLTEKTLEAPDAAGRFRKEEEPVAVYDKTDNQTLHVPPPAKQLPDRMKLMLAFANDEGTKPFIHPVARSILLHFWLSYDHPFVDGNGRTARALFYWSMLKHGYWLTEYISISTILRKSPSKYTRSFLYSENDDNDATYFLLSQMRVIQQAISDLNSYLRSRVADLRATEALVRRSVQHFNYRQLALLSHALKHADIEYTVEGHAMSHQVAYETARLDLLDLEKKGLIARVRRGKTFFFAAARDLSAKMKKL